MKLKLAIICGVLIWIFSTVLIEISSPLFNSDLPDVNVIMPIITIVVTGFFGIIYIRNIETNEVLEGILAGIIFVIIDIILDSTILVFPHARIIIMENYPLHIISITILTILITTFLGYLAQMTIDLK